MAVPGGDCGHLAEKVVDFIRVDGWPPENMEALQDMVLFIFFGIDDIDVPCALMMFLIFYPPVIKHDNGQWTIFQ